MLPKSLKDELKEQKQSLLFQREVEKSEKEKVEKKLLEDKSQEEKLQEVIDKVIEKPKKLKGKVGEKNKK